MQLFFSYSEADDRLPVGSGARFGFVSLVRLNLALSLARRGVPVGVRAPEAAPADTASDLVDDGARGAGAFAALLRQHRVAAGLSQEALAERARISANGLGALERGTRRFPQRETLTLLAQALGLKGDERAAFETAARREPKASANKAAGDAVEACDADVFVVVLTPAWTADERCLEELAQFATNPNPGKRAVILRRDPFTPRATIDGLPEGFSVDVFRRPGAAGDFDSFYRNDGTVDAAFYDAIDALAEWISPIVEPATRGSRVYVAPPAADMFAVHRSVLAELESAGYVVLADEGDLADTVASIHLLGEDDLVDAHGGSALRGAMERAAQRASGTAGTFRRIVFAPRAYVAHDGTTLARDPIAVRDRFGAATPHDAVIGEGKTDFIIAVKEIVHGLAGRDASAQGSELAPGAVVFLNFHPNDAAYARAVSKALRERGVRARFAAFEDDQIQNRIANTSLVRDSDAVVHCWASATDAWLYSQAADYEDWRKFGRRQPFLTRAAIAGPPERGSKALYSHDDPPEAIDVFLDLTSQPLPTASDLDPIVATVRPFP